MSHTKDMTERRIVHVEQVEPFNVSLGTRIEVYQSVLEMEDVDVRTKRTYEKYKT